MGDVFVLLDSCAVGFINGYRAPFSWLPFGSCSSVPALLLSLPCAFSSSGQRSLVTLPSLHLGGSVDQTRAFPYSHSFYIFRPLFCFFPGTMNLMASFRFFSVRFAGLKVRLSRSLTENQLPSFAPPCPPSIGLVSCSPLFQEVRCRLCRTSLLS